MSTLGELGAVLAGESAAAGARTAPPTAVPIAPVATHNGTAAVPAAG